MIGSIYAKTPVASYQPSKAVCDFTAMVQKDYQRGTDILNREYVELNDLSPIARDNRDKRTFNAFVDENIEDPNDAWRWRGTRSKARNKAIAMHAKLTSGYIIPNFLAQNDADEEDRDFSDIMRDCSEWLVNNSNYKSSFLMASMGMLVNCVTYMGAEWAEVYQTIKEKIDKGYEKKEILDEILSGFQAPVYSAEQVLISNAFTQNIQKQRVVMKDRWIEYSEAEAKYGEHENWQYVKPGVTSVFNASEGVFYDVKDDDHPYLVKETTPMYRQDDTEACFLGGVYMGDENVENNPMRHRDNRNAPKYPLVPFGYQRVDEHFFFYKSLMNSQYWDNNLLDAQYEMGMNRLFLDGNMPVAVTGTDKYDGEVIFPNAVTAFESDNVKITPLLPATNFGAIFAGMNSVEKSMDESSVSDTSAGQLPGGDQKATGIAIAEQNAKTLLEGVGKTLAESVVQYGTLMADIIVNHLSVAQVTELSGDVAKMKYKRLILPDKMVGGQNVSKVIHFDESLLGLELSDEDKTNEEMKMLESTGYPENKQVIYRINPELFARLRYLTRVEPERMFAKNEAFLQAMHLQLLTQLENNPFVSLEALTRKTLYQFFHGETSELMQKQSTSLNNSTNVLGDNKGTSAGDMAMKKAISGGMRTVAPPALP